MTYLMYALKEILWGIYNIFLNGFYYCRFYLCKKKLFSNPPINSIIKEGWELTFDDEFDGTEVDFTKWNKWYSTHTQHKPGEVAGEASLDCIEVKDGYLHLNVKDNPGGDYPLKIGWLNSAKWQYIKDGGLATSGFEQQYGYFEIRCKPPKQGLKYWPAFWLYGNTWPPEIDIFEFMGEDDVGKDYTRSISMTEHFGTSGKMGKTGFLGTQLGRTLKGINWNEGFHTYACRWEWNYIEFYIDNVKVYRIVYNVPNIKMSVIVNTAGKLGYLPKPEELPADFVVDYIRVYEKKY